MVVALFKKYQSYIGAKVVKTLFKRSFESKRGSFRIFDGAVSSNLNMNLGVLATDPSSDVQSICESIAKALATYSCSPN